MNRSMLFLRCLNDPRGPEKVLPGLSTAELADLIDALFQNLDTREPEFGAQTWYGMAVEESRLRSEYEAWAAPASAGGIR